MSLLPISLPLYPIVNPSDAVQKMLEKDAEAANAWPSDDKKGAQRDDVGARLDLLRPINQVTAVERPAATVESPAARSGGETGVQGRLDLRT